ncbi:MAG TPA: amino acid adenylation domain-containing protein [Ktedonobacteraceae bacterium]|nr:amino acid adenylation domain-containing protein [Ktedonobacteraceae bacterium]
MQNIQMEPIAIVGIGCRFPGANTPQAFWELLREGRESIREVPPDRWKIDALYDPDPLKPGKMVSRWGGFIDQVDQFDWRAFRMLPREVKHMDPQHRLLLEVAWEALEDAGLPLEQVAGSQTSVSIGIGWSDYLRLQSQNWSQLDGYTTTGNRYAFAANRISYVFDLRGPSVALDTGCTSSLSAIHLACQSLWTGEANLALAGGVNLILSPDSTIMVSKAGLLSPEGRCKTLDAGADGYVRGEGAGIIVLKPLSQVQRSDRVYACIRGIAVNHNGHNEWMIAPSSQAQEALLRDAYRKAGVNPAEVDYVELHGTGFTRGDPVEAGALGTVVGAGTGRVRPCLIGSVKTNIGHLEAAAGIASAIKVALSLYHREIPPTLNLRTVNPAISLDDLHLAAQQTHGPWPQKEQTPLAGVTTLALTGANAHMILAASDACTGDVLGSQKDNKQLRILPLSARSMEALHAQAAALKDFLRSEEVVSNASWQDICYTASMRRTHHQYRLAVTGHSPDEAAAALDSFLQGQPLAGISGGTDFLNQRHKLVFLFAHRGAQWSLVDNQLLMREPAFRATIEQCNSVYHQLTGRSLYVDLHDGSATSWGSRSADGSILHFTLQVALAALWRCWGIVPDAVLGEGPGEVAAAYVAGVLSLEDAFQFILNNLEPSTTQADAEPICEKLRDAALPLYSAAQGLCAAQSSLSSLWKKQLRKPELAVCAIDQLVADNHDIFVQMGPPSALLGAVFARLQHHDKEGTVLSAVNHTDRSIALKALATLYSLGYSVDWSVFYPEEGRCVSLPVYCWQRERLWPDWLDVERVSTPPECRDGSPAHNDVIGQRLEMACYKKPGRPCHSNHALLCHSNHVLPCHSDHALPCHSERSEESAQSIEEILAKIWAETLGLKQVDVLDSFFELGGHSLLAAQLLARIQAAFQVDVSLSNLFQAPTPTACAALIAQAKTGQANSQQALPGLPLIEPDPGRRYLPFPITDVQQAYWVGRNAEFELGNVGNHGYIEVEAIELDLERFNRAMRRLIERHEMLRAVILPDGRQQILAHVPPFQVEVMDLRELESRARTKQLEDIRQAMDHQLLPVEQWPSFEIRVSRLDEQRVRIHLSVESLFVDAWSMNVLVQEFIRFYHEPDLFLPPPELSFRDYVVAEAALRDSELYRRSQEYWAKRLPLLFPAPDLPLTQNPASLTHPRFVDRQARLDAESWWRLKARAAQAGVTASCVLLTAFAEVLATWSKNPRFSINLTLFNRLPLHPQVNDIVGDFTSLIPLSVDNSLPDAFENRARRLQEQLWSDLDHSYYSGVRVMRDLARTRGETVKALMPVVFTSLLIQDAASRSTPPWQETIYCVSQTPQMWLDHQVIETGGELVFHWQAVEALFPPGLLDAMFEAYCRLLRHLATEETSWREVVRKLVPKEQLEQRARANATEMPMPETLLHTLFLAQLPERPRQAAVIAPSRTLTYQEVYNGSTQLAQRLRQLEVRPNRLVAVVMEKGWEQVVAVLGVLQSGAAYLPIDPGLPAERLTYLLEHAEVEIVLTQSWIDRTVQWPANIQRLLVDTLNLERAGILPTMPVQEPEDLAYVIYTSGSTGLPKGVMIDHRGAVNTIMDINRRFGVSSKDRVLALSSLSFDLSVYDIFGTLAVGGTIVMPGEQAIRNPAVWLETVVQERVTIWNSVPALLQMLVEYAEPHPELLSNACLRLVLLSGDWIPLSLPDRIKKLFAGVEVISLGGATEASIWSIFYPIDHLDPAWTSIPYGRPLSNQQFHVLNELLEPCPTWVPGQLYIAGIGLARGYWHDENKTRASFITHPRTNERLYRTGDLGRYLPDGTIEFLGREDFQVKVQGYRIELGEIEAALARHEAVGEAIVTAVGERHADKRLVAYVVPKQGHTLSSSKLRYFLQEQLPIYMVPSTLLLLDALPLTANGKVDRKALPSPIQVTTGSELAGEIADGEAAFIGQIAQVVGSVLEVDKLDARTNLLEYGATSLSIIRIVNLLEQKFHFRPRIDEFFRVPTVMWLAMAYEKHLLRNQLSTAGVEQGKRPGLKPLSIASLGEREEGEL